MSSTLCAGTGSAAGRNTENVELRFGFEAQVRSQIDETPSFSTLAALGLPPAVLDRPRPALRVWLITAGSAA